MTSSACKRLTNVAMDFVTESGYAGRLGQGQVRLDNVLLGNCQPDFSKRRCGVFHEDWLSDSLMTSFVSHFCIGTKLKPSEPAPGAPLKAF